MAKTVNQRKKWGLILLIWPIAGLIVSFLLFAVVNWAVGPDADSPALIIMNVILFIVGAASVALGLPSIITGIVLLATSGAVVHHQQVHVPAVATTQSHAQPKTGLSIASMVLGIISVIVWFAGFIPAVLAVVFGAIGMKRKQGTGFAITGLVTGIIGLIISLIIFIGIIVASYAGVSERATDITVKTGASTVVKKAELYASENDRYPNFQQMEQLLVDEEVVVSQEGTGSGGDIIYIPCYGEGAIVWYWNKDQEEYLTFEAGVVDDCEWN